MRHLIHRFAVSLVLLTALFMPAAVASAAGGATSGSQDAICAGIGLTGGDCKSQSATKGVSELAATIINILSIIVGIVAVIMIVVGGFRYVTSGGDSNSTAGAKNTIIYALVGLLVVAIAQLLVHFVLYKLDTVKGLH